MKIRTDHTLQSFFAEAAKTGAAIDLWIDHPNPDYQYQSGVCYQAAEEFLVMGPEGSPARICIPYQAVRWFRADG